jgi:hypothetical protein
MLSIALTLAIVGAASATTNFTIHVDTSKSTHVVDPLFMGVHMASPLFRLQPIAIPVVTLVATCLRWVSLQVVTRIAGLRTPNAISTRR